MRTVYDIVKELPESQRGRLMAAGIIPQQWQRYVDVYEHVSDLLYRGIRPNEAYRQAGEKYFTSFENVRNIMKRMRQPVDLNV